jgi:dTDP-glucose 4,6-dehydratase/UDP-glucuronate decarboxylase
LNPIGREAMGGRRQDVGDPKVLGRVVEEDLDQILARSSQALHRLAGTTVIVTGAAGFLLSYVVDALAHANDRLLDEPCRVVAVDNMVVGDSRRLAHLEDRSDVVFLQANVVEGVPFDDPVDYIVHGASIASPTWYRRYPLETIDVNVGGTRRLLELAREHGARFLLLSSSEIYGDPPRERVPTDEDYWGHVSSTGPRAPYDESKRLAETLCTTFHRHYGTPVVIVRPFNVYGPRLSLEDGRVIPDFLRDALAGDPVSLLSDGRPTRSFCYVSDFVAALLLLLVEGASGEAYNVGNDEEVSIRGVAELVAELAGSPGVRSGESSDPDYLADNPSRRCPDLRKTKNTIQWSPNVPLRAGLARTLAHYHEGAGE